MKIRNLNLRIGKKLILDDVSFEINTKTALIGPNGSGKTMTLSSLSQVIRPQRGEVTTAKHGFQHNLLYDESFKENLGVLIQNGLFDPEKTVIEEMSLIKELKQDDCDLIPLIRKYNIDENMMIKNLPHGKYKILLVLQALMGNPEMVILDEPFSGLDILNRKIIEGILIKYKGKIIITSHQLSEIKNICKDVVFIKDGRIIERRKLKSINNLDDYYIKLYS